MWARRLTGDAAAWKDLHLQGLAAYPKASLTTHAKAKATRLAKIAERLNKGHTFGLFNDAHTPGMASLVCRTSLEPPRSPRYVPA